MHAYFRIPLALQALYGGRANLEVPSVLRAVPHDFVLVNGGGEEAIVRIEQSESVIKKLAQETECKKLTPKQLEEVRGSYAAPSLKQRYRPVDAARPANGYALDAHGKPIVETVQTVRSGIYLIDVPVVEI